MATSAPGRRSTPQRARIDELNAAAGRLAVEQPDQGLVAAQRVLRIATRARYTRGAAQAGLFIGRAAWRLGQFAAAIDAYQAGAAAARRARAPDIESHCVLGLGICMERVGDFDAALACFDRFMQVNPIDQDPRALKLAAVNASRLMEQAGRLDDAMALLRRVLKRLAREDPLLSIHLEQNLGVMLSLQGRQPEAAPHLARAVDLLRQQGDRLQLAFALCNLGRTLAQCGEHVAARHALDESREIARSCGARNREFMALVRLSELAVLEGEPQRALALAGEALALAPHVTDKPDLAQAHETFAQVHEAAGLLAQALHHARESARLTIERLSAASSERAQRALAQMQERLRTPRQGGRAVAWLWSPRGSGNGRSRAAAAAPASAPGSASAAAAASLSARDRAVLQMLAEGRTNAQIGEALQLSMFTARYHVSSLLNKLGAATRGEAVAIAARRGLL